MTTVKIICFNLPNFPTELEARQNSILSWGELERADRLVFPHLRRRFVLSHLGLRLFLAQTVDNRLAEHSADLYRTAAELNFTAAEFGKPRLSFPRNIPFNFSHSGDWAALAVADSACTPPEAELGLDLESVPSHSMLALAKRFFSLNEWHKLASCHSETQQKQEFARLWTRKEACLKLWGTGLHTPLNSFEVIHSLPANVRTPPLPSPCCLYLKSTFFVPDMCLSLALSFRPNSLQTFLVTWQDPPTSFQF
ncbi:MAG: 4'-phosphopantetheinyl transferase family protein [Candidatus Bruticola sp.]